MKKTYFLTVLLLISLISKSQTTLFSANFNGNNGGFNILSGAGDNEWIVNNSYTGLTGLIINTPPQPAGIIGNPNSEYLHITNSTICGLGICNANYDTGSTSDVQITTLSPIVTTGYSGVSLTFWYLSGGFAGNAYGTVEYAVGGIGPWTQVGGQLQGITSWTQLTLTNPAFDNQTQLRFRFRWQNGNALGADPAFSIDDIFVKGSLAPATGPVYLYSTANAVGTNYATLKSAFDAVNAGTYTGNLFIEINGDTTETASAVLNASGIGASSYTAISIKPVGGARTISGNLALPMVDLNGADNVTIDGIISGVKSLTISNSSTSNSSGTSTIRFQTDATNNTITNCNILGSSTMLVGINGGNIWFGAGSSSTGNDNNTISNCNIGAAGLNLPSKGVYFSGTTTNLTLNNSGNTITNNNFIDVFSANTSSSGIYVANGSTACNITDNKFYQTTTKTFTSGQNHTVINISNTTSAQDFRITGNTIGYANNVGTGTYSLTGSSGKFIGIFFNGLTSGINSDISNNTITNVSLTSVNSSGTGSGSTPFAGILIDNGVVSSNNNTLGSQTDIDSLLFSTTTTTATDVFGVFNDSTNNSVINNNNIGGITVTNSGATGAFIVYGIRTSTGVANTCTATNNLIGGTILNSIKNNSIAPTAQLIGLTTNSSALTATSNQIRNLTTTSANTNGTTTASLIGILVNNTGTSHVLSKNTIYNLSNTNTTSQTVVNGIVFSGGSANLVEKNFIYSLTSSTNSSFSEVNGILASNGTTTYSNNFIAIGQGISNAIQVSGINEFLGTNNFWHNSIYIGGSPISGNYRSFAFNANQVVNTRSFRNNIFWNARSNSGTASGKNYVVRVAGSGINPSGLTINNNNYYATGTGAVFGLFNSLDVASLAAWQTAVGQDALSYNILPTYVNPTNVIPDLHISTPDCGSAGLTGANIGVLTDFDDDTRISANPRIGADENLGNFTTWNGTSWSNGPPTLTSFGIISGDYDMTLGVTRPSINACKLVINSPAIVKVDALKHITIKNDLIVDLGATLNILDKGSLVHINDLGVNTINGTFTMARAVNQNISSTDYVYWSSPVTSFAIASVSPTTSATKIWEWTPSGNFINSPTFGTGNWINAAGNMTVGKGYIIRGPSTSLSPLPFSTTFSGVPNNGIQTVTISRGAYNSGTYAGSNSRPITDADDNWNLVGNPYPSAIKTLDFLALNQNIEGAIRLWTHGTPISTANPNPFYNSYAANYSVNDYITHNGTGTTSGPSGFNGFIAAGQSFFINMNHLAVTPGSITFKNSLRSSSYDNSQFYRTSNVSIANSEKGRIWLNLISNASNEVSRILVGYVDGATQEKDRMFDAVNVYNGSQTFSSLINNDMMIIQGRALPFDVQDVVPLAVEVVTAGNYSIAISDVDGLFSDVNQNIFLQDNLLNTTHDLRQAPYQFNAVVGDFKNRFVMKYTNSSLGTSGFDSLSNAVVVSAKEKIISVSSAVEKIISVEVYDVLGRKLFDKNNINDRNFSVSDLGFENQGLILKIKLVNEQVVTKKMVF